MVQLFQPHDAVCAIFVQQVLFNVVRVPFLGRLICQGKIRLFLEAFCRVRAPKKCGSGRARCEADMRPKSIDRNDIYELKF